MSIEPQAAIRRIKRPTGLQVIKLTAAIQRLSPTIRRRASGGEAEPDKGRGRGGGYGQGGGVMDRRGLWTGGDVRRLSKRLYEA